MNTSEALLVEVFPMKKRTYSYTFQPSDRFVKAWWGREPFVSEVDHWVSIQRAGDEVARCKFCLFPGPRSNPLLGEMLDGQLDIVALEVAVPERGRGLGRETLRLIRSKHPAPRLTALNDDEHSRGFWDRLGWVRHESPHPFMRSERVTYSEI
jgi:hypothetical protein